MTVKRSEHPGKPMAEHVSQINKEWAISRGNSDMEEQAYCISACWTRTRKSWTLSLELAQRWQPWARNDRVVMGVLGHRKWTSLLLSLSFDSTGRQHKDGLPHPLNCRRTLGRCTRRVGDEEGEAQALEWSGGGGGGGVGVGVGMEVPGAGVPVEVLLETMASRTCSAIPAKTAEGTRGGSMVCCWFPAN